MPQETKEYDFVIIGSGFGGSVSAMRLSQKGYKVALLEMGKKYENKDFPKTNWNIFKYLWAPFFRCFGIQKITFLKKLMVLHGIGVGGGSLVYANTLMRAIDDIFKPPFWPKGIAWAQEMASYYQVAEKMLGVTKNPYVFEGEQLLKKIGKKMGIENTYHETDVGIFFGEPDQSYDDPYFCGDGPSRKGCISCGACMIGCPNGAKNTLDKNYLYFAQKWGTEIFAETKAKKIIPKDGSYLIETIKSTSFLNSTSQSFKAKKVILSAGVLGTMELLLKNKIDYKTLPNISNKLGTVVRTNGECLLGNTTFNQNINFSKGIAIGAAIHPDQHTKIEAVRYSEGSGALKFLGIPATGPGNAFIRPLKFIGNCLISFPKYIRSHLLVKDWAKSTIILLVMQSLETKMKLEWGRTLFSPFFKKLKGQSEPGEKIQTYIPIAQEAILAVNKEVGGLAQNIIPEVLMQTPATAHILGGAIISNSKIEGVVSTNHEVFDYQGLYICDASVIPSNLGVNPSLTISALAERFTSQFEPKNIDEYTKRAIRWGHGP